MKLAPTFGQGGYKLEDFENLPIGLPESVDDDLSTKPPVHAAFRRFLGIATGHTRTRERQLTYARFYAYLHTLVDAEIVKLLDALDANGLTDDTLIVRTSDHGELGMAHGRGRQKFYNAYRESLSIPLIFSNPTLYPEPVQTDSLASLIDLLPTLATIAGAPDPEQHGFRGHDLTPILTDPAAKVQDALHFCYEDDVFPVDGARFIRAITEKDWKYAVYYDPYGGAPIAYELYDLANDPLELTNLAHERHRTPASDRQRARLHALLTETMRSNHTTPDEIRWPAVKDFVHAAGLADTDELAEESAESVTS